ncbi:hypothetical protein [Planosporangium mesophilum]|uniref:DUF4913 domain-containing protein n=1 Tax=Planosporangium mesophilum TaxID=689768 RepID=A0A8J3TCE6_9ACTN|nr:hypothetical protein [Planosporangium mesophilum]NJC83154.1 hypothetical protein [Planosporangium mesophilum]GII22572.1 hypothetical protein Pme01_21690 [Planosporangium mesophilum]
MAADTPKPFAFQLPDNAPPDMQAIALLGEGLDTLRAAVAELAAGYDDLRGRVDSQQPGRRQPATVPVPLRWQDLDRVQASNTWVWLINWVGWVVARYQLAEELPRCWPKHPPLVEELTALCAAWYAAYGDDASADAPLLWHERLARARIRLHDWDDATRCRNGTHSDRRIELNWPSTWRLDALETAEDDLAGRRPAVDPGTDTDGGDQP